MFLLTLALATMPQPIGGPLRNDLTGMSSLVAEARPGTARVELTVDPAGQPVRCDIAASNGVRNLDRAACTYLMRSARFAPARDAAGAPVAAVIRADFAANAGGSSAAPPVDFAVTVDKLPGRDRVAVADLVVMTDAGGRVAACDVAASSRVAALDRLACRQIEAASFAPARDRGGVPIAALRAVSVAFTADTVPR